MDRILVVEDNDANYLLIEEILSAYDISLVRAVDGKSFHSIISKSKSFSLVLMDLMLPDTDGIELTKFLINNNIRIPVVFISAYTERCEEIYELGVDYFLQKPVMTQLFKSVISKYVSIEVK
jgi:two-component system sensor histidine kinase BarA